MDKLHAYLRVSSKDQKDTGFSLSTQRNDGKKTAKAMGLKYVEVLEGDEGAKSSKLGVRKEFEGLKDRMRDGEITHIWFKEYSRFSRGGAIGSVDEDWEFMLFYIRHCDPYGVRVFHGYPAQEVEGHTTAGKIMMLLNADMASEESKTTTKRTVGGKETSSKLLGDKGKFQGGTPIFGFKVIDKFFALHKEESQVVKELFKQYAKGTSISKLKVWMDSTGIKPRRAKTWNMGTLQKMLGNIHYTGIYVWTSKSRFGTGETFTHTIPQIINHSLFNRVQKQLKKNLKNKGNNARQHDTLLGDLLVCECGANIAGVIKVGTRKNGTKLNSRTYSCTVATKRYRTQTGADCNNKRSLHMQSTDEFVLAEVKKIVGNSHQLKQQFKEDIMSQKDLEESEINTEKKKKEREIIGADKNIELIETSISTVKTNIMLNKEEKGLGEKIINNLFEERNLLQDKKLQAIGKIDELDNRKEWLDWVSAYGKDIETKFDTKSKETLEGLISEIVVCPVIGKNRDNENKQLGHKLRLKFELSVVDDELVYNDSNDKSKDYEIVKGKKSKVTSLIPLNMGGRPQSKKKAEKKYGEVK